MDSDSSICLAIVVVLVVMTAYFSAVGAAFSSVSESGLKAMADDGDRKAGRALKTSAGREKLRITVMSANMASAMVAAVLCACVFADIWGTPGAVIAVVIVAAVMITCSSLFAALGEKRAGSLVKSSVPFIRTLEAVMTPVSVPLLKMRRQISGRDAGSEASAVTEEEILTMLEEAETAGSIGEEHSELIQKAIGFYDLKAEDVMTPRPSIRAVDSECSNDAIFDVFKRTEYSRLPVYEEELDKIIGVINEKDFRNHVYGTSKSILDHIVPVIFVSASMKISELLQKMQEMKIQMAIVIDEYGGTEGLVTVEDIIEELVGEIFDEHDAVISKDIMPLQNGSYRIKCSAGISRVFEYFDIEKVPDVATVNGWVVMNLDKMPEKNDTFEAVEDGRKMKVRVTKADGKKAVEINLRIEDE